MVDFFRRFPWVLDTHGYTEQKTRERQHPRFARGAGSRGFWRRPSIVGRLASLRLARERMYAYQEANYKSYFFGGFAGLPGCQTLWSSPGLRCGLPDPCSGEFVSRRGMFPSTSVASGFFGFSFSLMASPIAYGTSSSRRE